METALAGLILCTLLFGMMEAAQGVYTYHLVSDAAREGTRYAIVRGGTFSTACTAPTTATCAAQSADVQTYVKTLGFPGMDVSKMVVTPSWSSYTAGQTCPKTGICNTPGNQVKVIVQYNYPISIPFVSIQTWTLTSTSAMVIAQ